MAVTRRRGQGYRSSAEIRRVRTVNLMFALVATLAIGIQIYLITAYFSARHTKKDKSDLYEISQNNLDSSQQKVDTAKSEYDALIADIANLENKLAGYQED